jgi:DNA-directed RNA polymerase specialized sigma24 family protein
MAAMARPLSEALETSPGTCFWCRLLLAHLEELTSLAWTLVADGRLVEETFERAIAEFDTTPFDENAPLLAYHQARKMIISQAMAVLESTRTDDERSRRVDRIRSFADLPDRPCLAFLLRMVIRSSAKEVAEFLGVAPCEARELVCQAINQLSGRAPSFLQSGRQSE